MDVALLLSLFATRTVALQQMAGNFTNFVSSTLSCEGTSTYAFTPLQTVTITVGGEYTFSGNGTPSDIYYTPPPPCSEVIDPDMSTTFSEESTSTTLFPAIPTTTPSSLEPTWTTICSTSFYSANMTANRGAPYANTTRPALTSCATVPLINGPIFSASLVTSAHSGSLSEARTEETLSASPKLSTLPAESVAPPHVSASADVSKAGSEVHNAITVTVTKKTPVPLSPTGGPNNAGPTFPGGGSDVVTPNSKQTPTPEPTPAPTTQPKPTNTNGSNNPNTNSPDLPNNSNNNPQPIGGSSNDNKPTSGKNSNNAQPTGGNGNSNKPTPGDSNTNDQNSNPTGSNNNNNNNNNQNNNNASDGNENDSPTGLNNNNGNQNNNSPTAGNNNQNQNNNNAANPAPTGNGLGSIINSVFNSPFSIAIGVTTSFGRASPTATLVAGVPIQIGPSGSSVYIGGSNIALPTGTSSAFVTIAGQTFTVAPSAIVAGSSTLTLHRPASISYSPVQAATLAASTITHGGITVTVEPSFAVVSGRTFTIGLNAPEGTTVINSQTITFNSDGVIFPAVGATAQSTNANGVVVPPERSAAATTYRPALTTAPAYIITTLGALTFSIDSSEAIISGTTYRIGAGSLNSMTTTVLDGTTVVFGPSGVVLPHSTTLKPTAPQLTQTQTGASAATRIVEGSATGTATATASVTALASGGAGTRVAVPSAYAYVSNTVAVYAALLVLAAGMLPLSLVL